MERLTERELNAMKLASYTQCKTDECVGYCGGCNAEEKAKLKLKEYEDLEELGLLLRLPCKVGDTVYEVYKYSIGKKWVRDGYDHLGQHGHYEDIMRRSIRKERFRLADFNRIGINIFLTEEEAEHALVRLEKSND